MHDPLTQVFQIKYPWKKYGKKGHSEWEKNYRDTFITIWHKDPEKDGSDDSCGWFKRSRHGDKATLQKIIKRYSGEWDNEHIGWFDKDGNPIFSVIGIVNNLVWYAAFEHLGTREKANSFMRRNIFDILFFAENPVDSLFPYITQKYSKEDKERRIEHLASITYGWILRQEQRWWQHAKWHIHHWSIQIHPWQALKRYLFARCAICKKGFKYHEQVMGNWSGNAIWHMGCNHETMVKPTNN